MSSGATPEEQQKARDDLFNNIKDNQKEGLVKEIKDLNDATTASISRFEGLLTAVKTADLKAVGVWKAQYDRTRSTYDTYKSLVDNIKAGASSSKNALKQYYQVKLQGIIEDEDDDNIAELEDLLETLQKPRIQTTSSDAGFGGVLLSLGETDKFFKTALVSAKAYDAEIDAVKGKIQNLQAEKKVVDDEIKKLIPETLAAIGIDPASPKIAILVNTAVKSLIAAIEYAFGKEWSKAAGALLQIRALNAAINKSIALEKQIKEENKELTSLAYKKGRLDEEKQRWQEINVDIGVIHDEITDLNPKLSSIPKVTDALRADVEGYVEFLKSGGGQDPVKKAVQVANMQDAGKLYQALANALETFATT